MKPDDLLTVWPSKAAIAKAFNVKVPSVYDWFYADEIPEPRQYQAQVLSKGKLKVNKPQKVAA